MGRPLRRERAVRPRGRLEARVAGGGVGELRVARGRRRVVHPRGEPNGVACLAQFGADGAGPSINYSRFFLLLGERYSGK